jgi:hypothetical protein
MMILCSGKGSNAQVQCIEGMRRCREADWTYHHFADDLDEVAWAHRSKSVLIIPIPHSAKVGAIKLIVRQVFRVQVDAVVDSGLGRNG